MRPSTDECNVGPGRRQNAGLSRRDSLSKRMEARLLVNITKEMKKMILDHKEIELSNLEN